MQQIKSPTIFISLGAVLAMAGGVAFGQDIPDVGDEVPPVTSSPAVPASECPDADRRLKQAGLEVDSFVPRCATEEEVNQVIQALNETAASAAELRALGSAGGE